jgi:hypothetical protein
MLRVVALFLTLHVSVTMKVAQAQGTMESHDGVTLDVTSHFGDLLLWNHFVRSLDKQLESMRGLSGNLIF